ncbi:MAG: sugar ABC transporter ATP-binding protein [Solirubrobacteraceae bacterium]|nr:sugar ABC transporter ATP-binding protein [Solirubrobacteraceae bacterium]
MTAPTIELTGLTKRFDGVLALDGVDLTVVPGEIHGLLGENGSGKSTLIKVLAGFHGTDGGRLSVAGEEVPLPLSPDTPKRLGLEFVHQDLGMIESLSVVENLRIGEMNRRRMRISWADEHRRAREVFDRYGIDLDPRAIVADVRPVQRAQLAIARAMEGMRAARGELEHTKGLLVLDEPTVFLPREEVEQLFTLMRDVAASGASVLFVSHDLDEVRHVTDRVTVLRDGRHIDTCNTAEVDHDGLVERIIGRKLEALVPPSQQAARQDQGVLARVTDVRADLLDGVSLEVRAGEVLGITGLLGSGFERLPYVISGAARPDRGTLHVGDREFDLTSISPIQATRAGVALVPADRKNDGAVQELSVTDNVTMPVMRQFRKRGKLNRRAMTRATAALMDEYDVRPRNPSLPLSSLSGGNQQKAVMAKWLQTDPQLLLLHEPTQGVDIGARGQIFEVIRRSADEGRSVVCASSDHEQLAAVCDRVLVFARGRIAAELSGSDLTKERITERCLASTPSPGGPAAVSKNPEGQVVR